MTKQFEIKIWLTLNADDEDDARRQANDIFEELPTDINADWSVEGEGAVYELEDNEDQADMDGPPYRKSKAHR